jgi:hypothetical protein
VIYSFKDAPQKISHESSLKMCLKIFSELEQEESNLLDWTAIK